MATLDQIGGVVHRLGGLADYCAWVLSAAIEDDCVYQAHS
jgi:hypothetical protein